MNDIMDMKISGSSAMPGGEYRLVSISGSGKVQGSLRCESLRCSGSARVQGDVDCAGEIRCSGSSRVTGAIACALEKDPALTNTDIKTMLMNSADDLGLPRNQQGWGRFNRRRFLGM